MRKNSSAGASGVGIAGLLQVAFVVLKLCGVINWSWFWVLSPAWISALILMLAVLLVIVGAITKK